MKKRVPRRRRISLALALSVPALLAGIGRELHLNAKPPVAPAKTSRPTVLKKRLPATPPVLTLDAQALAGRKNVQ
jgi:hypothetical protein